MLLWYAWCHLLLLAGQMVASGATQKVSIDNLAKGTQEFEIRQHCESVGPVTVSTAHGHMHTHTLNAHTPDAHTLAQPLTHPPTLSIVPSVHTRSNISLLRIQRFSLSLSWSRLYNSYIAFYTSASARDCAFFHFIASKEIVPFLFSFFLF